MIQCRSNADCPQKSTGYLINSECDLEESWSRGQVCIAYSNQDCLEIHNPEECDIAIAKEEEEKVFNAKQCANLRECEASCRSAICLMDCGNASTCLPQKPVYAAPLVYIPEDQDEENLQDL